MKLVLLREVFSTYIQIHQKADIEQLAKATLGESWLGLKKVHQLTSERDYSLHVNLTDFDGKSYSAVYDLFKVRTFLCFGAILCRGLLVSFPNPLAPGSDIQIQVSWGTRLGAFGAGQKGLI